MDSFTPTTPDPVPVKVKRTRKPRDLNKPYNFLKVYHKAPCFFNALTYLAYLNRTGKEPRVTSKWGYKHYKDEAGVVHSFRGSRGDEDISSSTIYEEDQTSRSRGGVALTLILLVFLDVLTLKAHKNGFRPTRGA